ncbi:Amidophosphoribosyltransferase [Suillus decipiens]|nr:Amidophosphoribosyltransferase [Suillus decipiens]
MVIQRENYLSSLFPVHLPCEAGRPAVTRLHVSDLVCGILGLLLHDASVHAASEISEGLSLLQHRGQDACGVANGMVRDVLDEKAIARLIGGMGIGHVRYLTAGSSDHAEAQPFYVNSPYGIKTGKFRINKDDVFTAIGGLTGAYACVAMLAGFGIIAFRDPNGIRPVGMASRRTNTGRDHLFASESIVADALGFSEWEDLKPGEAVIISRSGVSRKRVAAHATFAPDIFEFVYFARPDSVLDGISVCRSRIAMGDALAVAVEKVLRERGITVDVVIPVPDTSRVAALNLAQKLNSPYREGFVKNRYVGRAFIMPGQQMRRKNVRRKLNAMAWEFAGKNVLLVDDSIDRGTTSEEIIQMAKDVGAKKVIIASCAPPIQHSDVYGIDVPSRTELVAYGRNTEEIAEAIGADLVVFQTLPDLIASVRQFNPSISTTGGISEEYLHQLESQGQEQGAVNSREGPSEGGRVDGFHTGVNTVPSSGADDTVGLHNTWNIS